MQGREGLLSFGTLPSLLGLNGILNWSGVPNPSPYGYGLWFLTVLWGYYALYPLLASANRSRKGFGLLVVAAFLLTTLAQLTIPQDTMIWLTLFAFLAGTFWGRHGPAVSWRIGVAVAVAGEAGLEVLVLQRAGGDATYFCMLLLAVGTTLFLLNRPLPRRGLQGLLLLGPAVLPLYLVHRYLFVRGLTGSALLDFLATAALTLPVSLVLGHLVAWVSRRVPGARRPQGGQGTRANTYQVPASS